MLKTWEKVVHFSLLSSLRRATLSLLVRPKHRIKNWMEKKESSRSFRVRMNQMKREAFLTLPVSFYPHLLDRLFKQSIAYFGSPSRQCVCVHSLSGSLLFQLLPNEPTERGGGVFFDVNPIFSSNTRIVREISLPKSYRHFPSRASSTSRMFWRTITEITQRIYTYIKCCRTNAPKVCASIPRL